MANQDPRLAHSSFQSEETKKPKKEKTDFPSRQKEIDAANRLAQAKKPKPPKKESKPFSQKEVDIKRAKDAAKWAEMVAADKAKKATKTLRDK